MLRQRGQKWRLKAAVVFLILLVSPCLAEEVSLISGNLPISESLREQRFWVDISPDVVYIQNVGTVLTGAGIGASFMAALASDLALGAGVHEAFDPSSGFSGLFSELNVELQYAITGSLLPIRRTIKAAGTEIFTEENRDMSGVRLGLLLSQYFFNATPAVPTFTGLGGEVLYQFAGIDSFALSLGVRMDWIFNGKISLIPLRPFAKFGFRL